MYQVTPETWNEIAAEGALVHPTWARIMSLPESEMMSALDQLAEVWEQSYPERSVRAALLVAPLLAEHAAISAHLEDHPMAWALRSAMPEILSVGEAVAVAEFEFMLEPSQAEALERLLVRHLAEGANGQCLDQDAEPLQDSDVARIQSSFDFPLGTTGIRAMLALEKIFGRGPAAPRKPSEADER